MKNWLLAGVLALGTFAGQGAKAQAVASPGVQMQPGDELGLDVDVARTNVRGAERGWPGDKA